jgi:hypothetical protein
MGEFVDNLMRGTGFERAHMNDKRRSKSRHHCQRLALVLGLLMFSGCTSPLWWHDPDRGFIYRGWSVNIADHGTVVRECAGAVHVLGCVKPETMTAFSVNNPYVLAHECDHIENIMNARATGETIKDAFYMLFGVNDILTAATILLPAPNDCGEGTMAQWQDGKLQVLQTSYGTTQILPTLEQWQQLKSSSPDLR